MKKLVKTLKVNKLLIRRHKITNLKIDEKTRLNTENKQTFDLTSKIEIDEKTRQNAENKQTFHLTSKIEMNEKINQFQDFFFSQNLTKQLTRRHYTKLPIFVNF